VDPRVEKEMSEEQTGFHLGRVHKMMDWLESEATEWANDAVISYYQVEAIEDLTKDQIEEVIAFWYEGGNYHDDDYISMALRNVISNWENENEEYLI
jgi:hypothetical protein